MRLLHIGQREITAIHLSWLLRHVCGILYLFGVREAKSVTIFQKKIKTPFSNSATILT